MKRHDTHLLSDESENESKEEEGSHQYNFSKGLSDSNSQENYISNELNKKTPIKLNLENNNFQEEKTNSIISSGELEDIFQGEKRINSKEKKKKSKIKKHKLFVKLKKININKDKDDFVEDCLTFSPSPRYDLMFDKDFINLRTTKFKKQKTDKNNKNENNENKNNYLAHNTEKKEEKKNLLNIKKALINGDGKDNEVLYFFYNDDNEGNKKLKKVINILNKEKSQLYRISNKNCFTIRNTNFTSISSKRGKYTNPFKDNYRRKLIEKYNSKKDRINYSAKISFNGKKNNNNNNYIPKEDNKCANLNISLQNYNKFNNYRQNLREAYNKNCSKEKILYDLYCNKLDSSMNSIKKQRIKSTDSLMRKRQNYKCTKKTSNVLERDDYFPEEIRYMELHEREKENRKIIQGMFRKAGQNFNDFNRHVGNDTNCPVCQAMQMKNENNIKIKGINPLFASMHNISNYSKNSWQNRRIYSALSRVLTKKQIDRSTSRSINISNNIYMNRTKVKNKSNNNLNDISRIKSKKDAVNKNDGIAFRKLNFNRNSVNQNKFPNSNKIINFKNNILYN